jgi:outer membrane beta-barrel protein
MIKILKIVLFQLSVLAAVTSGNSRPAFAQTPADEKIDVSDLEKRYWTAKDSDFAVVQNRLFSKEGRVALSLEYGSLINDAWSESPTLGVSANYYLSERWGVEVAYTTTDSKDNQAIQNLRTQNGFPDHNKPKTYTGVGLNWVPFYAKMAFLSSRILYFDMSITPGLGVVSFEQQIEGRNQVKQTPAVSLDLTQHLYLTQWLALRLDLKNRWYQDEIVKYRNPAGGAVKTNTTQNSLLMVGLTLFY